MHEDFKNVSNHLMVLGIGMLAQAQKNALYVGHDTFIDEGAFAVLQAAQSAELLIKAIIAEQHPLLIFSKVPKSTSVNGELLSMAHIFENGHTLQYVELPEKLWASTGYKIKNQKVYSEFGKLRNTIQHFALPGPEVDLRKETIQFIYQVIDPLLNHFWNDFAVNYIDIEDSMDDTPSILLNYGVDVSFPKENEIL